MASNFASVPYYPADAIFELTAQYKQDRHPRKVNLGQGAYRDDDGNPWLLPSVAEARKLLFSRPLDHEYLPILGLAEFRNAAVKLVLGRPTVPDNVASCQSLSGTGALHLIGTLLKSASGTGRQIWIPEPTWSNHLLVFQTLGFDCQTFTYYNPERRAIDFETYKNTLQSMESGSIVILHACAHNPTGCDPTQAQWRTIGQIMKSRKLFPLFDAAYLGFNSGDVDTDAYAIRYFSQELELEIAVAVSFAKNMGLYGERVGCSIFVTRNEEIAKNCASTLEKLQRAEISNPPAFGSKIAATILNDEGLTRIWRQDLVTMCGRIRQMRQALRDELVNRGTPGDWSHIVQQSGMFGFLGLSKEVVSRLKVQYHVYMSANSRISIAGLGTGNVAYVAESIKECLEAPVSQQRARL